MRNLVDVREGMRQHCRLAQSRQQHRGTEPGTLGQRGQVGQGGEGLQAWLGHDAVTDPEIEPCLITHACHSPTDLERRPARRLQHHSTVWKQYT